LPTPEPPSPAVVETGTECEVTTAFGYETEPVGFAVSEMTDTVSTVPLGFRVTEIESFSGAVPSHWYTPLWKGALLAVVPAAGALESERDLPCQSAVVTPFWPTLVSWSFHGRFAATGPT